MKSSIQFFSLLTILFLFSIPCSGTESINSDKFFVDFRVTADLISTQPCLSADGQTVNGYSATVRVNLFVTIGSTEYLVASQTVDIPCGTVISRMTPMEFDRLTVEANYKEGVPSIFDYLNENDENNIMFNEIKNTLHELISSI